MTSLKEYVRDKQMLLVLDNVEQVLDAAPVVTALLSAASGLTVLVTSRILLRVYGEQEVAVPPLTLPDPKRLPPIERLTQYEAVRLFIERAQAAKASFEVTNTNAPAVAEICVRLDGLPLAIELAAARIKLLAPQAMLQRLDKRLGLLTGGARDLPGRHRKLQFDREQSGAYRMCGRRWKDKRSVVRGCQVPPHTLQTLIGTTHTSIRLSSTLHSPRRKRS